MQQANLFHAFQSFLDRLRAAKDISEFDQFMDERARKAKSDATNADDTSDKTI